MEQAQARATLWAGGLTLPQVAIARDYLTREPHTVFADLLLGEVIRRWGELDGAAALAYASATRSAYRPRYETNALVGWAVREPKTAWTKLMVISNRGADSRYSEQALMFPIAARDVALALELYEDLVASRACLVCSAKQIAYNALIQGKLERVRSAIAGLPTGPSRNALRDGYWLVLGEFLPEQGLVEVETADAGEDRQAARIQLAAGWAARDFHAALKHVLARFDRDTRDRALLPMIRQWAGGAVPEDVRAVIMQLPPTLSEPALLGVLAAIAPVDPRTATEWAATLDNPAVRDESLTKTMWAWASADGEAALAFVRQQQKHETRGPLARSFLLARVSNNTLLLSDLDTLDFDFNPPWIAAVLREVALRLADPEHNQTRTFDVKAFAAWVREFKRLDDAQKKRALEPLSGV